MTPIHKKLWPNAGAAAQLGHSVQMFLEIYARFVEEFGKVDSSIYESTKPNSKAREI